MSPSPTGLVELTCWPCLVAVLAVSAGYTVLVPLLSRVSGRQSCPPPTRDDDSTAIPFLVVADNREAEIAARALTVLVLDSPRRTSRS